MACRVAICDDSKTDASLIRVSSAYNFAISMLEMAMPFNLQIRCLSILWLLSLQSAILPDTL